MSVLKLSEVCKNFGKFQALDKISLEVERGKICGFIGPNGAGKSTTIRIILGLLNKTSGSVRLFDEEVEMDNVSLHERISYVPGDVNLWPNLTGGEVIDLLLSLKKEKDLSKKEQIIKDFEFDPTKKCRTYSKGNRQKVALIAALCANSELYIFDEATNGLDPLMESIFHKYLLELKAQNKAILLSSHNLNEVEKLCDHISIIKDGKIIESGNMNNLRHLSQTKVIIDADNLETILSKEYVKYSNHNSTYYELLIASSHINEFLKDIHMFKVNRLEISPPSLEEVFMNHYKNGEEHAL